MAARDAVLIPVAVLDNDKMPGAVGVFPAAAFEAVEKDLKGIYHMVGPQIMSKYDFGQAIAEKFGFDPALISPASVNDAGLKAARSPNLTLCTDKLVRTLGHSLPDFSDGLQKFYDQYRHGFPELLKRLF